MRSRFSSPAMVTSKRGIGFSGLNVPRVTGILRLRDGSALPSRHFAQDNNSQDDNSFPLNQRHFDARLLQGAKIGFGDAAIGDDFVQGRGRDDQRQAAAAEFAGVA